jgi:hypothetical protein
METISSLQVAQVNSSVFFEEQEGRLAVEVSTAVSQTEHREEVLTPKVLPQPTTLPQATNIVLTC